MIVEVVSIIRGYLEFRAKSYWSAAVQSNVVLDYKVLFCQ